MALLVAVELFGAVGRPHKRTGGNMTEAERIGLIPALGKLIRRVKPLNMQVLLRGLQVLA